MLDQATGHALRACAAVLDEAAVPIDPVHVHGRCRARRDVTRSMGRF
jgi:hypothetical protein